MSLTFSIGSPRYQQTVPEVDRAFQILKWVGEMSPELWMELEIQTGQRYKQQGTQKGRAKGWYRLEFTIGKTPKHIIEFGKDGQGMSMSFDYLKEFVSCTPGLTGLIVKQIQGVVKERYEKK